MTTRPPEAQLIYEAREARGLSQLAAAKAAGISDTYWRMVESGERVLTGRRGVRTLARMAEAAGVASGAMEAVGRAGVESALAAIRLERARTLEEAAAEADRMVATSPDLSARQRERLRQLVADDIREVRENG
jgi:transcriptional regulator with XRE-family HTH domain